MGMQELCGMAALLFVFGLGSVQAASATEGNPDREVVVQGNNAFALDLYAKLQTKPGNVFFCPYSIRTALTMTAAGASGNTAQQMAKVLHLKLEPRLHAAVQAWLNELSAEAGSPQGYQLRMANALWGQTGYAFKPEFQELLKKYYGAGVQEANFTKATEEARKQINTWVADQTQGKIAELFKPGILMPGTVLVLANATYFKGKWALPFDAANTAEAPFTLSGGEKVNAPMMHQSASVGYVEDDAVQVLELPYQGGQLSMLFLLPKKLDQLPALEAKFTVEYLQGYLMKLQVQKVQVSLPKFTIQAEFSLPGVLKELGMTDAFALPPADFSGMTGKPEVSISEVLHHAFVEVTEEGTEAAAATAVTMTRGLSRPLSFQADHPFLFVIRDKRSNGLLFLGRVMDPRGAKGAK